MLQTRLRHKYVVKYNSEAYCANIFGVRANDILEGSGVFFYLCSLIYNINDCRPDVGQHNIRYQLEWKAFDQRSVAITFVVTGN